MKQALSLVALSLIAGAALAAIEVEVARPQGVDYSSYSSFGFKLREGVSADHPLGEHGPVLKQVRAAAQAELLSRGLALVKGGEPDMWITFYGLGREDLSIEGTSKDLGPVTWVGDPGAHSSRTVIQGTLLIEVFDAKSGERIWSGWATSQSISREKLRARAGKATRKILEAFPVE